MEPWQRWCARTMLKEKAANLSGNAFEDFFHSLMQLGQPGFFPVRTTKGDRGADGLLISGRKLYACYGPEVVDEYKVGRKFRSDLDKAITHRAGDFDTFVFVHNNPRGVAPQVTLEIAQAQAEHRSLKFENFGLDHMFRVLRKLDMEDIEDLLGPFPLKEMVTGVGMAELAPLLALLSTNAKCPGRWSLPSRSLVRSGCSTSSR